MTDTTVSVSISASRVSAMFDHLLGRNLRSISCVDGFWIPSTEIDRYNGYGWIDGLPNQDVVKITKVSELTGQRRCALDIGANIGVTSVRLSEFFNTVHAFEPSPFLYQTLRRNIKKHPNVTPHRCAIGNENGSTNLTFYLDHGQLSHIDFGQPTHPKWECRKIGPIQMRTIDSMNLSEVDLIKIDVEGFETSVVEGAIETIKRCRPIILIEQAGNEEKNFGFLNDQASNLLRSIGMIEHPGAWQRMKKDKVFHFPIS